MRILGAGIAGLLAGSIFQRATLFEAGPESQVQHKALLRFRTSAVGDAVGIEFRKVHVHKGVWLDGAFVQPDIRLANWYATKVIGRLSNRSVWNIESVDRYVAPPHFIYELAERCTGRVQWNTEIDAENFTGGGEATISTLPMKLAVRFVSERNAPDFLFQGITVKRWRVRDADVFQTVYFPHPSTTLYRASITGDVLIAEYAGQPDSNVDLLIPFGLIAADIELLDETKQRYGKIAPIDDAWRKQFIFRLSHDHNVFSLGRFGTWRNILLDDVLHDVGVLKKLMAASPYDRSRANA